MVALIRINNAQRWGEWMTRFTIACEGELYRRLGQGKDRPHRVATCDLLFAVRKELRIQDHILEWRLKTILTTAYQMGAFENSGFELKRGCGWRMKKIELRKVA